MTRQGYAVSLWLIGVGLSLSTVTDAQSRSPVESSSLTSIAEAAPTLAPFQHVRFCLRYPADCEAAPATSAAIELNAETLELIRRVNHDVNAAIVPTVKNNGADLRSGWTIAPTAGDCNDYAVTKRHELLQSSLPANALRLAVVKTTSGIGHLVLIVETTKGDLVLDNLTETIRPWQSTDYHWLKIQSAGDARYWYEIKQPASVSSQADRKLRVADR